MMMLFLCGAIYFAKLWQQFLRIDVEESFFKSICTRSKEEFLEANFVDNLKLIQNFWKNKGLTWVHFNFLSPSNIFLFPCFVRAT